MSAICWVSLDPRHKKIDIYPQVIANKIEEAYQKKHRTLYLGKDFYDATINFRYNYDNNNPNTVFSQTTKETSCGRFIMKPPGYRSVQRVVIQDYNSDNYDIKYSINIYTIVNGTSEKISENYYGSQKCYTIQVSKSNLIETKNVSNSYNNVTIWNPEYFNNTDNDNSTVVVWQWCRGTPEKEGNIYELDDSWWIPFLYNQNAIIEDSYQNNNTDVKITLSFDNSERTIIFIPDSCYAKQYDNSKSKLRIVRRTLISIKDLKNKFTNNPLIKIDSDNSTLDTSCPEIPNEFYCPITQDIMIDPVKTVDGHVYERTAIDRWFNYNSTSPLTGLPLASLHLEPYYNLKNRILNFKIQNPTLFT